MPSSTTSHEPSPGGESRRFKQLFLALEKALSESKKQVNCHEAVSECYGENISIFASSNLDSNENNGDDDARDMLASLVSERLQRINESVTDNFRSFLEQNDIGSKLLRFEQAIEEYEQKDRAAKLSEEKDKRTAQLAAENATLPEGITAESIMRYQAYRLKEQEKQKLLVEICSIASENKAIEETIREKESLIKCNIDDINKRNEVMAKAADINSLSG